MTSFIEQIWDHARAEREAQDAQAAETAARVRGAALTLEAVPAKPGEWHLRCPTCGVITVISEHYPHVTYRGHTSRGHTSRCPCHELISEHVTRHLCEVPNGRTK